MKVLYWSDENPVTRETVMALSERYAALDAVDLLRIMIEVEMPGRLVMVSSFGIESAVMLGLISDIDHNFPVLFLNTGQLFEETLLYRDQLIDHLDLRNVVTIEPEPVDVARWDADATLWEVNPDDCCAIRKVHPLQRALENYDGWISGRKRYQGAERANLPIIELSGGKVKLNPLAKWTPDRVQYVFEERGLPPHPLQAKGYTSVGCAPCTAPPACTTQARSGRWKGQEKTECGIHIDQDGKIRRLA